MAVTMTKVKDPGTDANITLDAENLKEAADYGQFPYIEDVPRLNNYTYYESLFLGNHFEAFNVRIKSERYGRDYEKLRYVMANFAGLISKVVADFLFSEPVTVTCPEGDQDFIDAIWRANKLDMQLYEAGLSSSYMGDALFKVRVGQRNPYDEKSTLIIEETTPTIYFPKVNQFNVRQTPAEQELAWTFTINGVKYLRKEIHQAGFIKNEVWQLKGNKIVAEVDLSILGEPGLLPIVPTGVNKPLLNHTPNWKTGNRYFGISDYHDLDKLFYAINNRLTKADNVLDLHTDPILAVPPGILDEKGKVKKENLDIVEVKEGEPGKPQYIVWDASLDAAFKQLEKLVDFLLMTSEISADVFGMGEGQSDSGRALKYKMLRTIAKAARKKLYFDTAIKDFMFTAQEMAKVWNLEVDGVKMQGDPTPVEITWADGIPVDEREQLENEQLALDAGITSKKDSIMRVYGVDEAAAERMLKEIEKEKPKIELPMMNLGNQPPGQQPPNKEKDEKQKEQGWFGKK